MVICEGDCAEGHLSRAVTVTEGDYPPTPMTLHEGCGFSVPRRMGIEWLVGQDPLPCNELGCLAYRAHNYDAAERWLKHAIELIPGRLSAGKHHCCLLQMPLWESCSSAILLDTTSYEAHVCGPSR